jgi:hypothetical protein
LPWSSAHIAAVRGTPTVGRLRVPHRLAREWGATRAAVAAAQEPRVAGVIWKHGKLHGSVSKNRDVFYEFIPYGPDGVQNVG